jgi:hypothetical protein
VPEQSQVRKVNFTRKRAQTALLSLALTVVQTPNKNICQVFVCEHSRARLERSQQRPQSVKEPCPDFHLNHSNVRVRSVRRLEH